MRLRALRSLNRFCLHNWTRSDNRCQLRAGWAIPIIRNRGSRIVNAMCTMKYILRALSKYFKSVVDEYKKVDGRYLNGFLFLESAR